MKKFLYFYVLLFPIVGFIVSATADTIVTDGLVSYWTFDRTHISGRKVLDVWGNNDASIVGNPARVNGKVGNALRFDGIDDYVNLSTLGDFGTQVGASTFEAWVKTSMNDRWSIVFKIHQGSCDACWELVINATLSVPLYKFRENGIVSHLCYKHDNSCSMTGSGRTLRISDGKWHHLVMTIELFEMIGDRHRRRIQIYKDGEVSTTVFWNKSRPHKFLSFSEPVYLGAGNIRGKAEGFFKGHIDEVRIYNRPLTENEVAKNFKSRRRSTFAYNIEATEKLPILWGTLKSSF